MACDTIFYQHTGSTYGYPAMNAVGRMYGEALLMSTKHKICNARFYLNPSGDITLEARVYACSGTPGTDGIPTGSVLAISSSQSLTSSSLTTWYDFTFTTPYTLNASTNYVIGIYCTSYTADCIVYRYDAGTVANANYCTLSGYSSSVRDILGLFYYDPTETFGWTGTINGITNPASIIGIDVENIGKVNGI